MLWYFALSALVVSSLLYVNEWKILLPYDMAVVRMKLVGYIVFMLQLYFAVSPCIDKGENPETEYHGAEDTTDNYAGKRTATFGAYTVRHRCREQAYGGHHSGHHNRAYTGVDAELYRSIERAVASFYLFQVLLEDGYEQDAILYADTE